MNKFQPVSVTRLYRQIADQIAGKIKEGDFLPGNRLPAERELAEQLQVSRTSVREALIALEIGGFVEVRVGSGVYVTANGAGLNNLSGALVGHYADIGAFELIDVHLLIEPECAARAATQGSEDELAKIITAGRAMEDSDNPRLHNRMFHLAISQATGNAAMALTVANLWEMHDDSVMFYKLEQHLAERESWKHAECEHRELIAAIVTRDPVAAKRAMRKHFLGSRRRLGEVFNSKQGIF